MAGRGRPQATGFLFVRTRDDLWYRTPRLLVLTETAPRGTLAADLTAASADWIPVGHRRPWSTAARDHAATHPAVRTQSTAAAATSA